MNPRECDCIADVVRCAHLGDTVLALFANSTSSFYPYVVSVFPASWPRTDDGKDYVIVVTSNNAPLAEHPYWGDSYEDALAAFYAAEEALLRGDV